MERTGDTCDVVAFQRPTDAGRPTGAILRDLFILLKIETLSKRMIS